MAANRALLWARTTLRRLNYHPAPASTAPGCFYIKISNLDVSNRDLTSACALLLLARDLR